MRAPTREQVDNWWRTLREHAGHHRCREWAAALAELIAADCYLQGPPADSG